MSDLISREAVLEIVNSIKDCISIDGYWAILERVKALPPVEQTEWISVKDRLPEEHKAEEEAEERYLVTYTYTDCKGNHICIGVDLYRDGKWWFHSEDEYEHITAWMPLPSPYKGDE